VIQQPSPAAVSGAHPGDLRAADRVEQPGHRTSHQQALAAVHRGDQVAAVGQLAEPGPPGRRPGGKARAARPVRILVAGLIQARQRAVGGARQQPAVPQERIASSTDPSARSGLIRQENIRCSRSRASDSTVSSSPTLPAPANGHAFVAGGHPSIRRGLRGGQSPCRSSNSCSTGARTVCGAPARQAAVDRSPGGYRRLLQADPRRWPVSAMGSASGSDQPTERSLPRDPPSHPVSSTSTGYASNGGHPHRLRSVIRQVSCRNAGSPIICHWRCAAGPPERCTEPPVLWPVQQAHGSHRVRHFEPLKHRKIRFGSCGSPAR
jgi:hypothetical protein